MRTSEPVVDQSIFSVDLLYLLIVRDLASRSGSPNFFPVIKIMSIFMKGIPLHSEDTFPLFEADVSVKSALMQVVRG